MTTLRDALGEATIVVTCGPGGVGKTTSAAALGLALASSTSARVLVLTIDPAKRLADVLGLTGIGNDPVPVAITGPGSLHVAMLDTVASWDRLIERHAPTPEVAATIVANSLYQNITRRFVQSHDYVAVERVRELVDEGSFDLLIVDTPPTRNAIDFLEAPTRMADFFSSRLLRWLLAPARGGLVGLAAKPFTQLADRILGTGFLADITEFFTALSSLHEGFVVRAREVAGLLSDPRTAFVVVSTLEREPVVEAEFFVRELQRRDLRVVAWLANRVLPPVVATVQSDDQRRAALAQVASADESVREAFVTAAANWSAVGQREQERLRALDHASVAVFAAPADDTLLGTLAGVTHFGEQLLALQDVKSAQEPS